jgi:hypothetical protein
MDGVTPLGRGFARWGRRSGRYWAVEEAVVVDAISDGRDVVSVRRRSSF